MLYDGWTIVDFGALAAAAAAADDKDEDDEDDDEKGFAADGDE